MYPMLTVFIGWTPDQAVHDMAKSPDDGIKCSRECWRRPGLSRIALGIAMLFALLFAFLPAGVALAAGLHGQLTGRLIVGYQGWFGCPNDFAGNRLWQHWFVKSVQPANFTVDLLPSLRDFDRKDLCDTGLKRPDGSTVYLYSAQNRNVVFTHFRWMKAHGIDGVAVQRFLTDIATPQRRARSDNVLRNVLAAAQRYNRVVFVTYDVSGANPSSVVADIRRDWRHLTRDLEVAANPAYLRSGGRPVLELWGFGFSSRPGKPQEVSTLIADLKSGRNGLQAAYVVGGVPTGWRTLSGDSRRDPRWNAVYRSYEVISPWSVGRFSDNTGADAFLRAVIVPDLSETRRLGIGYMPVIFPGFSWYNLMNNRGRAEAVHAISNQIPRRCGRFMWHQVANILSAGGDMMYGAMFDEFDEGTALAPIITRKDRLPVGARMVYLNEDGCARPDDWYLQIAGRAAEYMRRHEVPPRSLDAVMP